MSGGAAAAQLSCEAIAGLDLPSGIASATSIPAGLYTPLGGKTIHVPAFCRVMVSVWPEVTVEVWMPAKWNRKFLGVGNGGQAGFINYTAMTAPLREGYAVASTDTGHKSADTAWALNHLQRIIDYGYRGTHVMTQTAKAIVAAYYGRPPEHSYFDGCSNGGRQALMEAQRYPGDYDGIIAGDPAADWTHLYTGAHLWTMRVTDGNAYIPASKVPILADAVNRACDALDGITDGIINDPRRCHFDPATLQCNNGSAGSDKSHCFTAAQVTAIKKIWNGARNASGEQIQPGILPGGDAPR
jgi:feruloyl esterase